MSSQKEYIYLGIAGGNVYAQAQNEYAESSPVSITIYDNNLFPYYRDLVEGGMVMDKRPCLENEDFVSNILGGPMLNATLPPKSVKNSEGVFYCFNPLDVRSGEWVSLDLYADFWRNQGAEIGTRQGNSIVWEDGLMEEIS